MFAGKWLSEKFLQPKRVYLDYASATPVAHEVFEAMKPFFRTSFGNASAIHKEGVAARKAIESARKEIAEILKIRKDGVVFTSCGTESNDLALRGVIDALAQSGKPYSDMEIISSRIEHPSMLETLRALETRGVVVRYMDVEEDGLISIAALSALLSTKTVLVALSYVNSEIGVVQDVKRVTRAVRAFMAAHEVRIYTHLDACQAPLWLSCEMDMLGVDLIALDGGKCYGPKGVGVLARRHDVPLRGQLLGGGQEGGLRAGTENTPLIVGCARALTRAQRTWKERSTHARELRDYFFKEVDRLISGTCVNGSMSARVANNINISIPGIDAEFAVIVLDTKGIAASTRSACASGSGNGSSVVRALCGDEARATSTIRFTIGEETTKSDIKRAISVLGEHVAATRRFNATIAKN